MSHQDITNLPPQDSMLAGLERLARDTSIPTERITELFRLAERREQTLLHRVFNGDMTAMQMEIGQIMRDRPNLAFNSRYATEEQIDRAARPIYTKHGFSIRYGTAPPETPGNIKVVCIVSHRDGYWEEHPLEAAPVPANRGVTQLQAVAATVTTLKRVLIRAVLNLVTADNPEDNDGNAIVDPPANAPPNYADIVAKFEAAAARIADSDEARKLLEWRPGVMAITALPNDAERNRYMQARAEVQAKWLTPMASPPPAPHEAEIEGL